MAKIYEMSPHLADLISAGEVVERPCSVVKELVENSIDAGAKKITVEIKDGGMTSIRVTDDGTGIARGDVALAFLRHTTSKLRNERGLESISTLGFRGEALSAIAAVSKIEIKTRTADELEGTRMILEGGEVTLTEAFGCPQGTVMTVTDLFYNTASRRKFLKNDRAEGSAVSAIMTQLSLSNPAISIKYIRDGKEEYMTPGDGRVDSCVYCVLGRDVAKGLLPVEGENEGVRVSGYVCTPATARGNRAMQFIFLNGRSIKSKTIQFALERAYKNSLLTGRFPVCVLNVELPLSQVDVNVHPMKTEVRFSNEQTVAATVFWFTKAALDNENTTMDMEFPRSEVTKNMSDTMEKSADAPTAPAAASGTVGTAPIAAPSAGRVFSAAPSDGFYRKMTSEVFRSRLAGKKADPAQMSFGSAMYEPLNTKSAPVAEPKAIERSAEPEPMEDEPEEQMSMESEPARPEPEPEEYWEEPWRVLPNFKAEVRYRYVGEIMNTYILVEMEDSLFIMDKHAAHERIIFDKLMERGPCRDGQILISPVICEVSEEMAEAVENGSELLKEFGYDIDVLGDGNVAIRQVPLDMDLSNPSELIEKLVQNLRFPGNDEARKMLFSMHEELLYETACRAAIKAGEKTSPIEGRKLFEWSFSGNVRYCPHGRPVKMRITKSQIDKNFMRR